ncbi:hypothetical protein [Paraburkholderia humisilvae]|uniref:Uncharacterized protein n=1 Tax=Paraburkholderia humisilvae TaxID=627669 RepID=A0A6J5CXU1_9BURK|nr:hypothetical protein [Paraburkholderia humisilvae]CAB3745665.1 hypothetical protein LMG29542_00002 [Paraburkholderia humisilvae]
MILWGKEHEARAKALATACRETAADIAGLSVSNEGIQAPACADATLTIWGHGDQTTLAELMDVQMGQLIQNWRTRNSALKTVELVTCNAQHNQDPLAGYAKRVAKFVQRKYSDVVIKALPKGQHADDYSILWASANPPAFFYLTAPSKTTFDNANQLLLRLDTQKNHDVGAIATEMAKARTLAEPNNFTIVSSTLDQLRPMLATIKTD